MKTKKHPNANLENYSKLFAQLGLVLTLTIVYIAIQSKTFAHEIAVLDYSNNGLVDDVEANIEYKIKPPKKQIVKPVTIVDVIKKVDNDKDIIETVIEPVDPDTEIDLTKIVDEGSVDPIIEDVPFEIIEEAPAFPGCKGNKDEMKACFIKKVRRFVGEKFNSELAETLGLSPGTKKIFVMFKIDENGNITDVKARAPHIKLKEEAVRVINSLPKMKPGKQRDRAVPVKYALPIALKVK